MEILNNKLAKISDVVKVRYVVDGVAVEYTLKNKVCTTELQKYEIVEYWGLHEKYSLEEVKNIIEELNKKGK